VQLAQIANGLLPTTDFLDAFSLTLTDLVADVPLRAAIDTASPADVLGDVRCYVACAKIGGEFGDIVSLIGSKRNASASRRASTNTSAASRSAVPVACVV
jgi:hypothetical protein